MQNVYDNEIILISQYQEIVNEFEIELKFQRMEITFFFSSRIKIIIIHIIDIYSKVQYVSSIFHTTE